MVTEAGGDKIVNHFEAGEFTTSGATITGFNGSNPSKAVTVSASDKFTLQTVKSASNLKIAAENVHVEVQLASNGQYSFDYDKTNAR